MNIMKSFRVELFIVLLLYIIAGTACGTDSADSGTGAVVEKIGEVSMLNASFENIALSQMPVFTQARSLEKQQIRTLTHVDADNKLAPLIFNSTTGRLISLKISNVRQINTQFLIIQYDALLEIEIDDETIIKQEETKSGRALIDFQSGSVYNLSDYDINNSLVKENYLFITKNQTIYRIALDDIDIATPLNNPAFDVAGDLLFIINNKIITTSGKSFDIDAAFSPKSIGVFFVTEGTLTGAGQPFSSAVAVHSWNNGVLFDSAGDLWGYRFSNERDKIAYYKLNIDDNGATIVTEYNEYNIGFNLTGAGGTKHTFSISPLTDYGDIYSELDGFKWADAYGDHIVVGANGFVKIVKDISNGIAIEKGALVFPVDFPTRYQYPIYHNMSIYWNTSSYNSIRKMDLAGNNYSEIYSHPDLLNSPSSSVWGQLKMLELLGDSLIFYQYITATTIGTYSLPVGSDTPVLIADSKVDIEKVMKLSF
jgi:hypothetical protein